MGAGLRHHGFCFHYEGLECLRNWTLLLCGGPSAGDQGNSLMLSVLSVPVVGLWQGWESVQERRRTPVPGCLCWTAFTPFSCWFLLGLGGQLSLGHVVLVSSGSGELLDATVISVWVCLPLEVRGCCCDSPHINYQAQLITNTHHILDKGYNV